MKQTSVEWLFEKLWETPKDKFTWNLILELAKQMEKEQIIDAINNYDPRDSAEQYYNETYKSK